MRLFEISQTVMHIGDYPPDVQETILLAFNKLADDQRGEPEFAGGGACSSNDPIYHGSGIYLWLTEHLGDLTHRMAQRYCERMDYGMEYVAPKIKTGLSYIRSPSLFSIEINRLLNSNYEYAKSKNKYSGTLDQWAEEFNIGAMAYAKAHSKLTVYNEAQWTCREIAITLGKQWYGKTIQHLETVRDHLQERETWVEWASQATVENGNLIQYNG